MEGTCCLWYVSIVHTSLTWLLAHKICQVFPYIAADGSIREQLRSTHSARVKVLRNRDGHYITFWSQDPLYNQLSIKGCWKQNVLGDYCRSCRPDRMVHLAHKDCWKIAFASHRWTALEWSRLAVQTRPFDARGYTHNERPQVYHQVSDTPALTFVAFDSSRFNANTPLGGLLLSASTLPSELQIQIMNLLKGTLVASLLQTKTFVAEMLPRLHPGSTWTIQPNTKSLGVDDEGSNSSLSCRSLTISGRSYLSELALGQLKGSATHIPIANRAVLGLQFALGRFGLRGVRISYHDGSYSPWLGESSFCWVGTVRCSDLSKLDVITDVGSFF